MALAQSWLDARDFLGYDAFRVNPYNGEVANLIASLKSIHQVCKKKGLVLMIDIVSSNKKGTRIFMQQ